MKYQPKRLVFYPDGHRRWAKSTLDRGEFDDIEAACLRAYEMGAETCLKVIDAFRARGGEVIDIFLTRPATYRVDVQGRTGRSLAAIHDVIRRSLVDTLKSRDELNLEMYTRSDRPRFALPEGISSDSKVGSSWDELCLPFMGKSASTPQRAFTVNLLVNYDGAIDAQVARAAMADAHLTEVDRQTLNERLLPVAPSADLLLRTHPDDDANAYRLSSGPVTVLAETGIMTIPKPSPDVMRDDIERALDQLIEFRTMKRHVPEELSVKSRWFGRSSSRTQQ